MIPLKIIDFHNHIFPAKVAGKVVAQLGDYYHYKVNGTGEVDNLIKLSKKAGMYKVLVHSTATKVNQVETINDYVAAEVKKSNGYFIGFGTIHQDFEDFKNELKRMKELGLHGVKLHPDFQGFNIDCDKMQRIYEAIGDEMPVLVHVGDKNTDMSSPKRMSKMVEKFPEVTFIAAHFGGYASWDEAYEYLCGKDLYFDTSSSLDKLSNEDAMRIIEKHGVDKMLYGSDYPIADHTQCLKRFMELPLSDKDREKIFYHNAAGLLNIQ